MNNDNFLSAGDRACKNAMMSWKIFILGEILDALASKHF
jgi:hypothetical protein